MPIPPADLIDIGTDEDAGFWSEALRFAPFRHEDYPAPGSPDPSIQARHTDRRGFQHPPFASRRSLPSLLSMPNPLAGKVNAIMAADCVITDRLLRRQATMFRTAERQYGLTQKAIHLETGMSLTSLSEYARGLTAMSGPAIMKLAEWREFPSELLAMLFAGTGRVVVDESDDGDHDGYAAHCIDFTARYAAARHPQSEAGEKIGPNEDRELRARKAAA